MLHPFCFLESTSPEDSSGYFHGLGTISKKYEMQGNKKQKFNTWFRRDLVHLLRKKRPRTPVEQFCFLQRQRTPSTHGHHYAALSSSVQPKLSADFQLLKINYITLQEFKTATFNSGSYSYRSSLQIYMD